MIVNYTENGWEIIAQRAHGLLAAQIAIHWSHAAQPARWTELLIAIADHDDAQVELETDNLLTPQGGPLNFGMKLFDLRHCTLTMAMAISKSRYIALLCSMHLDFVYRTESKSNKEAAGFLKEQRLLQSRWRKELQLSIAEAEKDYRLLEWCDALSLLLCQHENQPEARAIEISQGPENNGHQLIQLTSDTLTVTPWPFSSPKFDLCFEYRLIEQLQFKDAADFRQAFRQAPVAEKIWHLKKEQPLNK